MPGTRRRVLVIDDNRDAADALSRLISGLGHDVRIAYDGLDGWEIAMRFKPEVIFLDIGMPRLNGFEFAGRLKAEKWRSQTKIIVCSGYADDESRDRSIQSGCDMHFSKPMDLDDIRKVLEAL